MPDSLPEVAREHLPDPMEVRPRTRPFDVTLRPPGSKSITNRLYLLAALADGRSVIRRPLQSADCDHLINALQQLGVGVDWSVQTDGSPRVVIDGVNGRFPHGGGVDLGDGGTPTRFMLAAAAMAEGIVIVDGSPRMRERPIAEGVALLRSLGADVRFREADGRLPVAVRPSEAFWRGGRVPVGRTASSQFVSALMLVAPWLEDGLVIETAEPLTSPSYVELTAGILADHADLRMSPGSPARTAGGRLEIAGRHTRGGAGPRAFDVVVEPDASSAIYWMAAAALVPGSTVRIPGLDLDGPQPDTAAIRACRSLGIEAAAERSEDGGPIARFGGRLERGGELDATDWPDGALAVAAMAAGGAHPVTITGLHTLRVKETDRIAALQIELERIGCTVESSDEHLMVDPRTRHERPVLVGTYDDHRMAMSFAILALVRPNMAIRDPGCVGKSYPGFWRDLQWVTDAE